MTELSRLDREILQKKENKILCTFSTQESQIASDKYIHHDKKILIMPKKKDSSKIFP